MINLHLYLFNVSFIPLKWKTLSQVAETQNAFYCHSDNICLQLTFLVKVQKYALISSPKMKTPGSVAA